MRILFEGGIYSGADTIISRTWWHRRWCQVKHKRMWTTRSWLVSLSPTCAGFLPLVYVDQLPPSSRSPLALLSASPTTYPLCGFNYLCGQVRMLIEGEYYFIQHRQSCGNYSRADTIQRADTIRGNTVLWHNEGIWRNTYQCLYRCHFGPRLTWQPILASLKAFLHVHIPCTQLQVYITPWNFDTV